MNTKVEILKIEMISSGNKRPKEDKQLLLKVKHAVLNKHWYELGSFEDGCFTSDATDLEFDKEVSKVVMWGYLEPTDKEDTSYELEDEKEIKYEEESGLDYLTYMGNIFKDVVSSTSPEQISNAMDGYYKRLYEMNYKDDIEKFEAMPKGGELSGSKCGRNSCNGTIMPYPRVQDKEVVYCSRCEWKSKESIEYFYKINQMGESR